MVFSLLLGKRCKNNARMEMRDRRPEIETGDQERETEKRDQRPDNVIEASLSIPDAAINYQLLGFGNSCRLMLSGLWSL